MGVRQLVSALLPREYREQVLGDLHERGFRVRDIASVLPRVWWSFVRRSVAVPMLAGSGEAGIRRRAEQFHRRRVIGQVALFALFGSAYQHQSLWEATLIFAGAAALLLACGMGAHILTQPLGTPPVRGRGIWLEDHRKQLAGSIAQARWGGSALPILIGMLGYDLVASGWRGELGPALLRDAWLLPVLPLTFLLVRLHAARLRKELETLR